MVLLLPAPCLTSIGPLPVAVLSFLVLYSALLGLAFEFCQPLQLAPLPFGSFFRQTPLVLHTLFEL